MSALRRQGKAVRRGQMPAVLPRAAMGEGAISSSFEPWESGHQQHSLASISVSFCCGSQRASINQAKCFCLVWSKKSAGRRGWEVTKTLAVQAYLLVVPRLNRYRPKEITRISSRHRPDHKLGTLRLVDLPSVCTPCLSHVLVSLELLSTPWLLILGSFGRCEPQETGRAVLLFWALAFQPGRFVSKKPPSHHDLALLTSALLPPLLVWTYPQCR